MLSNIYKTSYNFSHIFPIALQFSRLIIANMLRFFLANDQQWGLNSPWRTRILSAVRQSRYKRKTMRSPCFSCVLAWRPKRFWNLVPYKTVVLFLSTRALPSVTPYLCSHKRKTWNLRRLSYPDESFTSNN